MSETPSEEEDDSCKQLFKSTIIKIKPGKGHAVSPNSEIHMSSCILDWKDDDDDSVSMSLWMQRGDDHFLLCSLDKTQHGYNLHGRFNEPVPVRLYVKGQGDASINIFGLEKLKY